ncbi:MAG: hypothetical protein ACREA4_04030 [Nitrososphaera sp.]
MSDLRADNAVMSGSVKKLVFRPSEKILWMVVGRDNEHWSDPELGFCSCRDFYFNTLSGGDECYHLKSVRKSIRDGGFVEIEFHDSEYLQVLQAISEDHASLLGRR